MDPATVTVIALAVILVSAFFVGRGLNRRRAAALALALRQAFPASEAGTARSAGRDAFRVELPHGIDGAERIVATVALAPREAPLVWLLWTARGGGDLLDLKVDLDAVPRGAGLAIDPRHRLGREAARRVRQGGLELRQAQVGSYWLASLDASGLAVMRAILPLAAAAGNLVYLELRAEQPRLEIVLSLRGSPSQAGARLPSALRNVIAAC